MSERKTDAEKVFAWIMPDGKNRPCIPCGASGLTFGSNVKRNDVPLKRICAEPKQAEIICREQSLFVRDLGCNGFTELNGAPLYGEKEEELFHGDRLSLAGESFRVYRCDKLPRAEPVYIVSFVCEGETIQASECKAGDKIVFPCMPQERLEDGKKKIFAGWTDENGNLLPVTTDLTCSGKCQYFAGYRDADPNGTDTAAGTCVMDEGSYFLAQVPATGFRFGGSKQFECFLAGESGAVAEIIPGGGEIKALKARCVRVKGKYVALGESVAVEMTDILEICGKKYRVINPMKIQPGKTPLLRFDNGTEEMLTGLAEGKSVRIGRDYQKIFKPIGVISHTHAIIREENGKYFIRDNNSRNGTSLKIAATGEEIRLGKKDGEVPEARIENGDIIRLAFFEVTFVLRQGD